MTQIWQQLHIPSNGNHTDLKRPTQTVTVMYVIIARKAYHQITFVDDTRGAHTNETRNLRHTQITLNLHNRTSEYILYFADYTSRNKFNPENNDIL
jgi:hypothetical protein